MPSLRHPCLSNSQPENDAYADWARRGRHASLRPGSVGRHALGRSDRSVRTMGLLVPITATPTIDLWSAIAAHVDALGLGEESARRVWLACLGAVKRELVGQEALERLERDQ